MVDQYVANLRRYKAIALDVGDQDGLRIDTAELHRILDSYGIANSFELYPGDHVSAVADRMQNHVLPFFARNLVFESRPMTRGVAAVVALGLVAATSFAPPPIQVTSPDGHIAVRVALDTAGQPSYVDRARRTNGAAAIAARPRARRRRLLARASR